jgi:uncharacterized tellurite resistance protein B-like protein
MLPAIRKNISSFEIPEKHLESAVEANQFALNHYALAIAGRLCGVDGDLNLEEKKTFLQLFPYFGTEHLSLLKETAHDESSVYINCKRFTKFANDNINVSATLYGRLFNLACSDNGLNVMEISYLEKIAGMLGLSKIMLEKALEFYFLEDVNEVKKFDSYIDARKYYKGQMIKFHPDMFAGDTILSTRIKNKIIDNPFCNK